MKKNYTITQFSKLTGVTKRALQYYDEIGLLKPTKRSNGYREYNTHNLLMLQHIVTLKYLGLPIAKIANIIKGPESEIDATLANQMHSLRSKARTLDKVARLIEDALIIKNQTQSIDWSLIIKAIRGLQTDTESGWFQEFYTQEELLQLKEVWSSFNDEQVYAMVDWYTLMVKQLTEQTHLSPSDPVSQATALQFYDRAKKCYEPYPFLMKKVLITYRVGMLATTLLPPLSDLAYEYLIQSLKAVGKLGEFL